MAAADAEASHPMLKHEEGEHITGTPPEPQTGVPATTPVASRIPSNAPFLDVLINPRTVWVNVVISFCGIFSLVRRTPPPIPMASLVAWVLLKHHSDELLFGVPRASPLRYLSHVQTGNPLPCQQF